MSRELATTTTKMTMPEVLEISKLFAESGMFEDAKQMAQAFVKVHAGNELGIPALQAMSGIFIIKGKVTVGAGLIASKVKDNPKYDYKIVQLDAKVCSIDFFENGSLAGNSTFTFDDAVKAGTQNMAKFPKNMLFARAMSNGQKWYAPDAFQGPVYTPEELGAVTLDVDHQVVPEDKTESPEPVDYTNSLQECGSIEDLQAAWKVIPVSEQPKYLKLKDECKNSINSLNSTTKQDEGIEEAVLVDEVEESIQKCDTIKKLQTLWKSFDKSTQDKYELSKDIKKQELTQDK